MEYNSMPSNLGRLLRSVVLISASDIQPQEVNLSLYSIEWFTRPPNKTLELIHAEVLGIDSWDRPVV